MLVAVSLCPHPPLLTPDVSIATPAWLADLRSATVESVRRLGRSGVARIIAVGAGPHTRVDDPPVRGDLRRFGVTTAYGSRRADPPPTSPSGVPSTLPSPPSSLPLPLAIAAYLLDETGWSGDRRYATIAADATAEQAADLGRQLVSNDGPLGLLVMGDGSAKRSATSPGYLDTRAAPFDRAAFDALGSADSTSLLGLDRGLADELWVQGVQAWQVLGGAARATVESGATIDARTTYDGAPAGVGYAVIEWRVAPPKALATTRVAAAETAATLAEAPVTLANPGVTPAEAPA